MKSLEDLKIDKHWESFLAFRDRRLQGVPTGIEALDKAILGLGGVTIVQGSPGSCKSVFALQVARHNAAKGMPVFIIDRENGLERFRLRLTCQLNTVSQADVLTCSKVELRNLVKPVMTLPFYVCTEPITNFEEITTYLKRMYEVHERPMMLIVDSLQSLPFIDKDERLSLQKWMQHFDQAKLDWEGKLTTIAISEKTGAYYDEAKLAASKGTGAIEYKAEVVLDFREVGSNIICKVLKNRDGAKGMEVGFAKVLADRLNPQSFCFSLEGVDIGEDL